MGRLQNKCNRLRLRLLATCSITITFANKQNPNVIDCDYIVSSNDYNRNCIRLEIFSERNKAHLHSYV